MMKQTLFSKTDLIFPATWKPLLSIGLFFLLFGLAIILFPKIFILTLSGLCFVFAFVSFRAALRSFLNHRDRRIDIIEID